MHMGLQMQVGTLKPSVIDVAGEHLLALAKGMRLLRFD